MNNPYFLPYKFLAEPLVSTSEDWATGFSISIMDRNVEVYRLHSDLFGFPNFKTIGELKETKRFDYERNHIHNLRDMLIRQINNG